MVVGGFVATVDVGERARAELVVAILWLTRDPHFP